MIETFQSLRNVNRIEFEKSAGQNPGTRTHPDLVCVCSSRVISKMIYSGLSEPVIYPVDFYIPKITQDVAVSDSILVYPSSTLLNQERIHSSWMIMISRYLKYITNRAVAATHVAKNDRSLLQNLKNCFNVP